uniref:Uncharacterized protein n=1 Tax=Anopheles christyi TaxID=43041 RepID=A0A182JSY5_9DIPT
MHQFRLPKVKANPHATMKTIACLVLASAFIACAVATISEEQREAARQLAGKCMQQTGASEDDVNRLRSGDTENADRNTRCFVQCFFQGAGFVDQDGNVQTEELTQKLASEYSQEKAEELCFGECFVKRAGFMNDNFTFNRDTIMRFMNRFVTKEISEMVYKNCTDNVTPTYCVTAFDVYQCIYENAYKKWDMMGAFESGCLLVVGWGMVLLLAARGCHAQDFKGAIDHCTKDFEMDMDIVVSLKYGDFTERDPLIECFTECLMKKSGFMYDDYTYNKTLIIGFAGRYLEPEGAQAVYDKCIDRFGQTVCVTGFEMYQCIHETAVSEWVSTNF